MDQPSATPATSNNPSAVDPNGVLKYLIEDMSANAARAFGAERLLTQLLAESVVNGAEVDTVAAELGLSRHDAEALMAGESILKGRIARS